MGSKGDERAIEMSIRYNLAINRRHRDQVCPLVYKDSRSIALNASLYSDKAVTVANSSIESVISRTNW